MSRTVDFDGIHLAPTTAYAYDGAGRLTGATDPRSETVTVAYDAAERVATITRPDATAETFLSYQERGWTNTGAPGSPAAPTLLAEARATHTDPLGNATDLRPDWGGLGLTNQAVDPDGNLTAADRDANGLATVTIDPLSRITQDAFDAHGNTTQITYPILTTDQSTYNGFSEPTTHTDPNSHVTTNTYDGNGNLTVVQDPLLNRTTMTYGRKSVSVLFVAQENELTPTFSPGGLTTMSFGSSSKGSNTWAYNFSVDHYFDPSSIHWVRPT